MQTLNGVHPREFIKTKPVTDNQGSVTHSSRSYLVISQNIFHQNTETCICLSLILNLEINGSFFEDFNASDIELEAGNRFNQRGKIDCGRIFSFSKGKIEAKQGMKLSTDAFSRIISRINNDVIEVTS